MDQVARRAAAQTRIDAAGRTIPTTRRSFGTVKQQRSGNYRASYTGPDGQVYAAPSTFTTKGDADAWLAPVGQAIRNGTWRPPHVVQVEQFGQYAQAWLEQRRTGKGEALRAKTRDDYTRMIRGGLTTFTNTRLADVTAGAVRKWHSERSKASGATTAGYEARVLRAILTTAVTDGLIPSNPVPTELTKTRTGRKHRPPTPEELSTILATVTASAPRLRLAVQLAAFGGLRLGEWRALTRADLALTTDGQYVVTVDKQAQRVGGKWGVGPTKGSDTRAVTLPAWLTDDVTQHLAEHVGPFPADLVFTSGGTSEYVEQAWRSAWDAAREAAHCKESVREHDLRHYYGTTLARGGASAVQIMEALGHADVRTSMGYVETVKGAGASIANLIPALPAVVSAPSNVVPLAR